MNDSSNRAHEHEIDLIRVFIVHDQRMLAEGLKLGLDAEFHLDVVGIAATLEDAEVEVDVTEPHVALVELAMADVDGITIGERLKERHPELKVLLLTGNADPDVFIARAIGAGFDGFLHKHASIFEAVHAINQVHDGMTVFAPEELTRAVHQARRGDVGTPNDLTEREHEILQLVAQGMSTAKMASLLFVSPHTVRSHVGHILAKLDTHSKGEAVAVGYRRGLITLR
jgi:DNA-binding NarL/FixJ family response regulator